MWIHFSVTVYCVQTILMAEFRDRPLLCVPFSLCMYSLTAWRTNYKTKCWWNRYIIKTVNGNIILKWSHNTILIFCAQLAGEPSWLCVYVCIDFVGSLIWYVDKRQIHTAELNDCNLIWFQWFSSPLFTWRERILRLQFTGPLGWSCIHAFAEQNLSLLINGCWFNVTIEKVLDLAWSYMGVWQVKRIHLAVFVWLW